MREPQTLKRRNGSARTFAWDKSRIHFVILAILVAVCSISGGSYSPTMPTLLVLRPLLVLAIGVMIALPGEWNWRGLRAPTMLLAIFAATMAIQLIPLPPAWWAAMPGHERYAGIVALAPSAWRPISLVPDLTINSMLALLPTLAVLVAFAGMRNRDRWNTAWIVLGLCIANVLVGLVQVAGGNGPTAIALRDDSGVVTGLLANRNHGAVLLGVTLPLVALLAHRITSGPYIRWLVLGAAAAVILLLILLSGSRQGLVLGGLALVAAAAMFVGRGTSRKTYAITILMGVLATALIIGVAVAGGRALSIMRLEQLSVGHEFRAQSFPVLLRMTRDFLPFGIGYGAFDPVFRGYEPDALLVSTYFNRAHNDLLETLLSGGLPALVPLVGLLLWLTVCVRAGLRDGTRALQTAGLAKVAGVIVAMLLLASLSDYPLRTGIMSMVFALAGCWLATLPRYDGAVRRVRARISSRKDVR